jgi:hypothetical protein
MNKGVYQMGQGASYQKQGPHAPQKTFNQINYNEKMKIPSGRMEDIRNSPGKIMNSNNLISNLEKRQGGPLGCQPRREDKKISYYSPQPGKEAYMQSPQKAVSPSQKQMN